MQALSTPSVSVSSETAAVHQRLGVAVPERRLAEPGDGRLLRGGPLQLLLGVLALGDVVEDAVPDRDAGFVFLEHRLVEDPDDLAVAGDHPVVDRRRVAFAERLAALLLERPLAIVGVQQRRPEVGVGDPLLGGVAEDLLDLRADVAPAPALAHLGRVDDRRQALDQPPVVLAPGGELIDELGDLLFGPAAFRRRGAGGITRRYRRIGGFF